MQDEFLFAGFGGQGVMFVGQLLAYAAMDEGLEVTWIPSYGPEMRGGTANCTVVISNKPIGSPLVRHPEGVIAFNNPSFEKYAPITAEGGVLAYNAALITLTSPRRDIQQLGIPATNLADELGDLRLMNMVMLGAVLAARPVVSFDAIRHALEMHISARRADMLQSNYKALDRGAAWVAATKVTA
jgi:2-oxoglutarate ferredoxin oxidoreductase subunit gamma